MKIVFMCVLLSACGEHTPAVTASDLAEKRCIEGAEAGVGKAALRANIDACRAAARDGGAE